MSKNPTFQNSFQKGNVHHSDVSFLRQISNGLPFLFVGHRIINGTLDSHFSRAVTPGIPKISLQEDNITEISNEVEDRTLSQTIVLPINCFFCSKRRFNLTSSIKIFTFTFPLSKLIATYRELYKSNSLWIAILVVMLHFAVSKHDSLDVGG